MKPDDGSYGKRLSDWHRRSLTGSSMLAELAAREKQSPRLALLAANLLQDVVPSWKAAKRMSDTSRLAWLGWLDALIPRRYDGLQTEFVERAAWLAEALREDGNDPFETLRPATRRQVAGHTRMWKST